MKPQLELTIDPKVGSITSFPTSDRLLFILVETPSNTTDALTDG